MYVNMCVPMGYTYVNHNCVFIRVYVNRCVGEKSILSKRAVAPRPPAPPSLELVTYRRHLI